MNKRKSNYTVMQHGFFNYLIRTSVSKRYLVLNLKEILLNIHNIDSV